MSRTIPSPSGKRQGSLRLRLTLWNVTALAAVLVVFGLGFRWTLWNLLLRSLDDEMEGRVLGITRRWEGVPLERKRAILLLLRARPEKGWGILPGGAAGLLFNSNDSPEGSPTYGGRILNTKGQNYLTGDVEHPWDTACFQRSLNGEACHTSIKAPDNQEAVRICSIPVRSQTGTIDAVVQTARSLKPAESTLTATNRTLLTFLPLALLTAAIVGTLMTDHVLRPVKQLSNAAERIGAADLSERIPVIGADEFARLAQVFNGMLSRLETAFNQQRRFTADASHELRSPLTVVLGQASLELNSPQSDESRRAWERTARAARTMERLVHDLLLLARSDAGQWEMECVPLSVRKLLEGAVESIPDSEREKGAPITMLCPKELWIMGDSTHLERAIHNLLSNALRHTPIYGGIVLSGETNGDSVVITITDTGSGISAEALPHVTERFYRVDRGRTRTVGGTGLGLAITESIAAAHGGTLTIKSTVGQGTSAQLHLKQASPPLSLS
jgi:signal transduction histidine kinase